MAEPPLILADGLILTDFFPAVLVPDCADPSNSAANCHLLKFISSNALSAIY
jgi:hypothetical protein